MKLAMERCGDILKLIPFNRDVLRTLEDLLIVVH